MHFVSVFDPSSPKNLNVKSLKRPRTLRSKSKYESSKSWGYIWKQLNGITSRQTSLRVFGPALSSKNKNFSDAIVTNTNQAWCESAFTLVTWVLAYFSVGEHLAADACQKPWILASRFLLVGLAWHFVFRVLEQYTKPEVKAISRALSLISRMWIIWVYWLCPWCNSAYPECSSWRDLRTNIISSPRTK